LRDGLAVTAETVFREKERLVAAGIGIKRLTDGQERL
jgi:hypothetical protein